MKKYKAPVMEFVEFDDNDLMTVSPGCLEDGLCLEKECEYVCPNMYGQACSGQVYGGN